MKGFPSRVTIEDVSDFFAKFGTVKSVRLRYRKDTKEFKGSAFVEMGSNEEAQAVVANKVEYEGKELLVMTKCE